MQGSWDVYVEKTWVRDRFKKNMESYSTELENFLDTWLVIFYVTQEELWEFFVCSDVQERLVILSNF